MPGAVKWTVAGLFALIVVAFLYGSFFTETEMEKKAREMREEIEELRVKD